MFAEDYILHSIYVRGEVSNCKYHSSGHIYFTLKDASGTISCVMFAGRRRGLSFRMKEGDQVIAAGTVDVYERDGRYQLYADRIVLDGVGLLNARYEELKRRLEETGMFDEIYKKPIPGYIQTLGVVTAPTGAAIRDIINISTRRNPYIQIILYPAVVQGDARQPVYARGSGNWTAMAWTSSSSAGAAARWKTCGLLTRNPSRRLSLSAGLRSFQRLAMRQIP